MLVAWRKKVLALKKRLYYISDKSGITYLKTQLWDTYKSGIQYLTSHVSGFCKFSKLASDSRGDTKMNMSVVFFWTFYLPMTSFLCPRFDICIGIYCVECKSRAWVHRRWGSNGGKLC